MASALGDVTFGTSSDVKRTICLLAAATVANGVPSSASAGVPAYESSADMASPTPKGAFFLAEPPDMGRCAVAVVSTAGSGTMVAKVTIWGFLAGTSINKWVKVKALNAAADFAEDGTDQIDYSEVVDGLAQYDRIYAELVSVGGTATAIEVYLTTCRNS